MHIDDFEHIAVPQAARKGFGSMLSVWITFQVSTVMLYFGAITVAHLALANAIFVVCIAAAFIALVSGITGYVGAKTGFSTSMLCHHFFGRRGGRLQQLFQGLVEFGWFVVIVELTGDTVCTLAGIDTNPLRFCAYMLTGILGVLQKMVQYYHKAHVEVYTYYPTYFSIPAKVRILPDKYLYKNLNASDITEYVQAHPTEFAEFLKPTWVPP